MAKELTLIEFSDFLVERVQPRSRSALNLPGNEEMTLGVRTGDIVIAAGCCCCCCCCNCNSGGSVLAKSRAVAPGDIGISSSLVTVQPGAQERRSKLAARRFDLSSNDPLKHVSFSIDAKSTFSDDRPGSNNYLSFELELESVDVKEFITHTWYGPERTLRFGGMVESCDMVSISKISLDGTTHGVWKVISRDISGAIISFVVFEVKGRNFSIIDAEYSPISALSAEVSSSVDRKQGQSVFSPRQGRLYFLSEFDAELKSGQIRHAWYRENDLFKLVDADERDRGFISAVDLPEESVGGWYVVATDESGRHITTSSFSVRPS